MIKGFLWFLLGLFLIPAFLPRLLAADNAPSLNAWRLAWGGSRELTIPVGTTLRLSQKKIIEVEEIGPQRFRLLALRSGLVYARALDSEGHLRASWMIEVAAQIPPGTSERLQQKSWQHYYCDEIGVNCDTERYVISGTTTSLRWLHAARRQCEKQPPCRFEVALQEEAQASWQKQLRRELGRDDLSIGPDGFARITSACGGEVQRRDQELRRELEERYAVPLLLRCLDETTVSYQLELIAVAQRSQSTEHDNPLRWEGLAIPPHTPLQALIANLSEEGKAQIIAQPDVQIVRGGDVRVSDGLEIETIHGSDEDRQAEWKVVGFQLHCQLVEEKEQKARMKVDMQLSRPRGGGSSLDASHLETELWMAFGSWQLLGRIQSQSQGQQQDATPWFASIPLLGPLFQWNTVQAARSEISLFARLSVRETRGVEPPQLPWVESAEGEKIKPH